MEERVSGFRVRRSWDDVVAHGEQIARALPESDIGAVALGEWEDWRPKTHEELGADLWGCSSRDDLCTSLSRFRE
ncbi:hypothetical protein [Haloarcula nitratireducens]|uniref:Uncharacterized protein n=1 Tax=Haloarcula nitratireducens TaxID=2487749 RepID=A0AAW4PIS4_9EURY|nr:hypothetical protein [Halomicroarcula nitratireducens]MBX0297340.1 hypothetical protein [Halomicroarcula nitratireducens]